MNKHNKDRIFALGAITLALYLGYESFGYPSASAFFPRVLAVLLGLLGILLFLRLTFKARAGRGPATSSNGPGGAALHRDIDTLKSAGLVFGSIIAYGSLVAVINYEAATLLFLASMILMLGFRRIVWTAAVSLGLTALLYFIFFRLLGVSRPESLFFL